MHPNRSTDEFLVPFGYRKAQLEEHRGIFVGYGSSSADTTAEAVNLAGAHPGPGARPQRAPLTPVPRHEDVGDIVQIQSSMASAFAGPFKGSRVIDQPQDVRFLNEDTAIVISEGGIVLGTGDTRRLPWFCGKPPGIPVGCPGGVTVGSGLRPKCPVLLAQP